MSPYRKSRKKPPPVVQPRIAEPRKIAPANPKALPKVRLRKKGGKR